jgi:hypothetical protein
MDDTETIKNIIEPTEEFDFSKISLSHPVGIQSGAFFTKIENNKKKLHLQTCRGQSRQGFVKSGKKYYIDLMFDKSSEELIQWFENLESTCQKLIFEKKNVWFQNVLEESDIESAFSPTIKIYKSGKFYLLRTNVKNNHANIPEVKIFNEEEINLTMDDVTNETNIISILEIKGIKFTTRNFQIDIELKQIMVLNSEPLFEKCLIKKDKNKAVEQDNRVLEQDNRVLEQDNRVLEQDNRVLEQDNRVLEQDTKVLEQDNKEDIFLEKNELVLFDISLPKKQDDLSIQFDNLEQNIEETNNLQDFLNLDDSLEPMQLKKPNQVYFELYKEARNKAKLAKKNAIIAYLEAKNIKKTYMLENMIDNSDSDFDAEIDEVSESELDNF